MQEVKKKLFTKILLFSLIEKLSQKSKYLEIYTKIVLIS